MLNLEKYANKKHLAEISFQVSVLIVNSVELCGVLFASR